MATYSTLRPSLLRSPLSLRKVPALGGALWLLALLALLPLIALSAEHSPKTEKSRGLAFPHAEGFGRFAQGGRGGDVYTVTSLEDYDPKQDKPIPGTLRHALDSQKGPRTVVFNVGGTIHLKQALIVTKSYLTLAGQSAPGDGITICDDSFVLKGKEVEDQWLHDIIIRFIRFRHGDVSAKTGDAITSNYVRDYIFDHISAGWAVDGIHDLRGGGNFTLQWSIYAEALNRSTHYKNQAHAMLASFREPKLNLTLHHNLMASSRDRHPTLGSGAKGNPDVICDFRNNVVYNWEGGTNLGEVRHHFVNNFYKPGESSDYGYAHKTPLSIKSDRAELARGYLKGNYFDKAPDTYNQDNYTALTYFTKGDKYNATSRGQFEVKTPFVSDKDAPATQSAQDAYELVLSKAGASFARDGVDERIIRDVRKGTGKLIDSQAEVGGWPKLKPGKPWIDSDGDGMPDSWERTMKLNHNDASDGIAHTLDKHYTNLEIYLNSLVEHLYN